MGAVVETGSTNRTGERMNEGERYCPQCGAAVTDRVRVAVWDYGVYITEYTCRPCDEEYRYLWALLPWWKRIFFAPERKLPNPSSVPYSRSRAYLAAARRDVAAMFGSPCATWFGTAGVRP